VLLAVFAAGFVSRVALVSGGVSVALLLVSNALWAASAFTVELEPDYRLDPSSHLLIEDAGFACFVSAAAAAIPLVLAISTDRRMPRWLAVLGIPAAAALAASYFYFPYLVFLGWIVCVSVRALFSQPSDSSPIARPSRGRDLTERAPRYCSSSA
jgi:hypothetical protein